MIKLILRVSSKESFKLTLEKIKPLLPENSSTIFLPKKRKTFSVLRSPHVNSKAKDSFNLFYYKVAFLIPSNLSLELISFLTNLSRDVSITIKNFR
jgi:ribosomal protein S10